MAAVEAVQCASCGSQYDSLEHAFCPRCGTTERDKAIRTVQRNSVGEKQKKIRRAGIVLTLVGALGVLLFGLAAIAGATIVGDNIEAVAGGQPGGTFIVVVSGDEPIANATVMFRDMDGELQDSGMTDSSGRYTYNSNWAIMNISVSYNGETWHRTAFALAGSTQTVAVSPGDDAVVASVVGTGVFVKIAIGAGIVFTILYGTMLIAGIQLLRANAMGLGLAAAGVGIIPALIFLFASFNIGSILLLGLLVWAFANLLQARKML